MVRKELTEEIILKGKIVKYADCTRVIENEVTVVADLLDEEETVLETNAVFLYEGEHKDSPFTLTEQDIYDIENPQPTVEQELEEVSEPETMPDPSTK